MASSSVFFGSLDANEPQSISFAPNMTEASFTSPEEPECAETNALLFPPADSDATDDSSLSFKRPNHTKKKDAHIPRPPNAFILFRSSFIKQQHIPGSIEGNHSQLSKIVGACWQRLSYEERQVWERKAKEARAEHKRLYPNYRFIRSKNPGPKPTPKENAPAKFVNTMPVIGSSFAGGRTTVTTTQSPSKSRRRNNRVDEDPRRCEQIAKLLVAGHKGSSLEAMMKKFDQENSLRQKQEVTDQSSELPAKRGTGARDIARRSSSCPPLDIAAAELFRMDGPKSTSGPIRRPKPLRAAATLPYPPTFKSSRSVSPPISPSYLATANTPIEGPFANSTFTFNSASPNFIPRPESIAPKEAGLYSQLSSPTNLGPLPYTWPVQPLSNENSFFSLPSAQCGMSASSVQTPMLSIKTQDGHVSDGGWNSEFEWLPTEDEAGTSTGPPSTPGAPSPVVGFTRSLPLEEVAAQAPYSVETQALPNEILDLSEYAKGLQLFSHDTAYVSSNFTIPTVNIHDLTPMNASFDHTSNPSSFWQLHDIIDGIPSGVDEGLNEYHY